MNGLSIRLRLTVWHGLLMGLTIAGLGIAAWFLMARSLLDRIDASLDFEFHEAAERLAQGRPATDPAEFPSAFHQIYHLRVLDDDGRTTSESPSMVGIAPISTLPTPDSPNGPSSHVSVKLGPLGECRVVTGRSDRGVVQIATSLESYRRELAELTSVLWTILPAGLAVATIGGYWLAGRALSPVSRMTEAAQRISAANLGERIETSGRIDELGRLAETLNAMLDRIDQSFRSVRQFTADAAHELKTPLATIRTEAEVALAGSRSPESILETFESIVEEADRLARLSDRLLILSRGDAGTAIQRGPVPLDEVLRESAASHSRGLPIAGLDALPKITVEGDRPLLRVVFDNLLDNAEQAGGSTFLEARIEGGSAIVEVADTGAGIPAEALPRIFDRFYRVDPSRSRRTGGNGLGLSIVKAVIERHGGVVEVRSTPGVGTTFRVVLPTNNGR